ncbi:MAG: hypothetical protein WD381_02230 [Balneolaceae bacterium]
MNNYSVAFEIPNINQGFAEVKGLLSVYEESILLEFERKDAVIGVFKSGLKEARIPYSNLEEMEWKKGFFRSKIILTGKTMRSLSEVPGAEQGRLVMNVKRKDREDAERVASRVRLRISEERLNSMED